MAYANHNEMPEGYEWDPEKNYINEEKHGIRFEEAVKIFKNPVLTAIDDGEYGELRERSFGTLEGRVVLCVVHTERDDKTRIISARKATLRERRLFDEYYRKALN